MKSSICIVLLFLCIQLNSQYCIPTYNEDPGIHIHNFNLGDIVNRNTLFVEGNPYVFFQNLKTDLQIGRTYPLTASGDVTGGIKGDWGIWIDYNNDEVFSEEERVWQDDNVLSTQGLLEIPNDPTIEGERRMRVSYVWTNSELDPCGDYSNGETEDYTVNFVTDSIDVDYYCMPFDALDTDAFFINDFTFGEISNLNSESNMFNYSVYSFDDFPNQFLIGETYDYTIKKEGEVAIDGGFVAWIEYDDDQIFEEDELVIDAGPEIFETSGMITIPNSSDVVGRKRMRVRAGWDPATPLAPCGFHSSTETEDYIINIVTEITDVSEIEEELIVNVYPNPSTEFIQISVAELDNYTFEIYNAFGQLVNKGELNLSLIHI